MAQLESLENLHAAAKGPQKGQSKTQWRHMAPTALMIHSDRLRKCLGIFGFPILAQLARSENSPGHGKY